MAEKADGPEDGNDKADEKRLAILKQLSSRSREEIKESSAKNPVVFRTIDRSNDHNITISDKQKHILYVAKLLALLHKKKAIEDDQILSIMSSLLNEEQLGEEFAVIIEEANATDTSGSESEKEEE